MRYIEMDWKARIIIEYFLILSSITLAIPSAAFMSVILRFSTTLTEKDLLVVWIAFSVLYSLVYYSLCKYLQRKVLHKSDSSGHECQLKIQTLREAAAPPPSDTFD